MAEDSKFSYGEVHTYLTSGEYPADCDKNYKRSLRRKAANFKVEDGRLYYIGNQEKRPGAEQPTDVKRIVVESEEEQRRIIRLTHDEAHLGVNRVLSVITPKYYWPGMYQDVEVYIKGCEKCQRSKPKLKKTPGVLHPIHVEAKAWHQIGIDLVGPLPETLLGNKYICTVTDYYTKWAEATALPSKEAIGVVNFLYKLFCVYGCPSLIISDQGREFINEMSDLLFAKTNTQHRVTSAYHPQTNGLTERFNQTLSNCLVSKINESQNDWDDKLDAILFSYRVSRQASTKYSPYFLMFGRHPRLPIDVEYEAANSLEDPDLVEPTEEDIEHALENLLSARMETKELASKNIKCAQQKQKEYYDRKHSPEIFEEGTEVLMENTAQKQRKGGKLADKFLGPYTINRHIGKGIYELKNKSGKVLQKKVNVNRLKRFNSNKDGGEKTGSDEKTGTDGEKTCCTW